MNHLKTLLAATAAVALASGAAAQVRGVTATEIRIGGAHDLSGVFAAVSTPAVNGANMYIDMVNAAGGVHGRQIRYIVEDHGYQLPRATQAFNKLIERDQVFAMLLNLGTPHNLAHYPLMERRGVPNINPLTAARDILPDPPGMNRQHFRRPQCACPWGTAHKLSTPTAGLRCQLGTLRTPRRGTRSRQNGAATASRGAANIRRCGCAPRGFRHSGPLPPRHRSRPVPQRR
jgi:hypothetical protein